MPRPTIAPTSAPTAPPVHRASQRRGEWAHRDDGHGRNGDARRSEPDEERAEAGARRRPDPAPSAAFVPAPSSLTASRGKHRVRVSSDMSRLRPCRCTRGSSRTHRRAPRTPGPETSPSSIDPNDPSPSGVSFTWSSRGVFVVSALADALMPSSTDTLSPVFTPSRAAGGSAASSTLPVLHVDPPVFASTLVTLPSMVCSAGRGGGRLSLPAPTVGQRAWRPRMPSSSLSSSCDPSGPDRQAISIVVG